MANTTIDSTGTLVYLVAEDTAAASISDCDTAISSGFLIGKITGNIQLGGTLATQEHKYLGDDTEYSMGSVSYGDITLDSPFSQTDNAGQEKLKDSFNNKTRYLMILKNTNSTYTTAPVFAKTINKTYQIDDFVIFNCSLQQNGKDLEITA